VLNQPPKDLAELEATAATLGVDIPPKGVGSLSWSGDQWQSYWDASKAGDSPQVAASKANSLNSSSYDSDFGTPQIGGPPKKIAVEYFGAKGSAANKIAEEYHQQVGGAVPQWEAAAARTYSGSTYATINNALWNDNVQGASAKTQAQIENISNLMKRWEAPRTIVATRGLNYDPAMPDPPATGKTYASKGFQSTSVGKGAFTSKSVVMKVTIPKGMNGIVMNGGNLSHYPNEEELLLPHNTRYVVTKDYMKGGKRWLEVTAMPPE